MTAENYQNFLETKQKIQKRTKVGINEQSLRTKQTGLLIPGVTSYAQDTQTLALLYAVPSVEFPEGIRSFFSARFLSTTTVTGC